jgi:hypothetical protein
MWIRKTLGHKFVKKGPTLSMGPIGHNQIYT